MDEISWKKLGFVFDRIRVFIDKQKIILNEICPKTVIFLLCR